MRSVLLRVFVILTTFCGCRTVSFRGMSEETCLGRASARHSAVYVHGKDTLLPSMQELGNRVTFSKIAKELDLRIALPRSKSRCKDNPDLLCWPQDDTESLLVSSAWIQGSADHCFSKEARFGIIGFSNGGFLASRLVQFCVLPNEVLWVLSVGSSGSWGRRNKKDLSHCGRLRLVVGRGDPHLSYAREYAAHLKELGADVELAEYPDGHTLPFEPIRKVIEKLLAGAATH